jgi:hypothetical protein
LPIEENTPVSLNKDIGTVMWVITPGKACIEPRRPADIRDTPTEVDEPSSWVTLNLYDYDYLEV